MNSYCWELYSTTNPLYKILLKMSRDLITLHRSKFEDLSAIIFPIKFCLARIYGPSWNEIGGIWEYIDQ